MFIGGFDPVKLVKERTKDVAAYACVIYGRTNLSYEEAVLAAVKIFSLSEKSHADQLKEAREKRKRMWEKQRKEQLRAMEKATKPDTMSDYLSGGIDDSPEDDEE